MAIWYFIVLICTGLAAGYMSGLLGLGGGVIVIPILIYALGFSQHAAQGTTLGMMVPPIGIIAAWQYHKAGFVDIKASLIMAVLFIAGSYLGSRTAMRIDPAILKKGFAVLLVVIAAKMFFETK